jgi:transcriptional regulator with XRE-family HTH domain
MKYPNRIKDIRKERGMTLEKLAASVNTSRGQIYQLENGLRKLSHDWMVRLAKPLHCNPEDFIRMKDKGVPILGYVGAGEQVYPYDDLPSLKDIGESDKQMVNCEFAEAPAGATYPDLIALRVKGNSMEPFLREGSLVYYGDRRDSAFDDLLNNHCVVGLKDGRLFLKILKRGSSPGKYNLLSHNATMIEDVELEWAAKVLFVKMV